MERGHGGIELFGHLAHGGRTARPAEDREQRCCHFAGGQPQDETRQDHAVDVVGAPGVGAHHLERAEGPGAWHGEFEVAELGQQVAAIAAIASVSFAELGHALEVLIDQLAPPTSSSSALACRALAR
jgi:hypothetical protein